MDKRGVIDKLKELIRIKPNRAINYYYRRSRRKGCKWSRDKRLRVYREQGTEDLRSAGGFQHR